MQALGATKCIKTDNRLFFKESMHYAAKHLVGSS